MRTIKSAKRELNHLKLVLDEFVLDYESALNEEDLSKSIHQEFLNKIGDVYSKYQQLYNTVSQFTGSVQ